MPEVRAGVLDAAPAPAPLCSDYAEITELRSREPEAIGRALAARRRRPSFLPPDGRLMLIAADHPARGALAAQGRPTAMHSRTGMLDRLRTALARPGVDGLLATADIAEDMPMSESMRSTARSHSPTSRETTV